MAALERSGEEDVKSVLPRSGGGGGAPLHHANPAYRTAPSGEHENHDPGFYYAGGAPGTVPETRPEGRTAPRRSKRHVPDGEKDGKYWEKRKRNNDAARRSRESKRRLDVDVRQRLHLLEEELNLLRKEVTVIKVKFGLPLDQRFLDVDERGELVGSSVTAPVMLSPVSSPAPSPVPSPMALHPDMAPREIPGTMDKYSMPSTMKTLSGNQALLPETQLVRSNPRHQGAPNGDALQHSHLGTLGQTSPNDHMPVKKRRRGRKDWDGTDDHDDDGGEGGTSCPGDNAYYGRMLSGNPYPGLLWPSPTVATQAAQFPFPGQMQMVIPAAYQALLDEQPRLPSINAFSSASVKAEQSQQGLIEQHQQQQQHQPLHSHQLHPPHQQMPHHQPAHNQPAHNQPAHNQPAHNQPAHNQPAHNQPSHNQPSHNQPPHLGQLSVQQQQHLAQSYSQQQSSSQQLTNGVQSNSSADDSFNYLTGESSAPLPRYYVPYSEVKAGDCSRHSVTPADLSLAKARHQVLDILTVADVPSSGHAGRGTHHQQIGVVQPMQGNQQRHQQRQQQQHQHQQQSMSSASEDDEPQERLLVNSDIRSRLLQLTAEVAKMKDYVLKDNSVRSMATSSDDQSQ